MPKSRERQFAGFVDELKELADLGSLEGPDAHGGEGHELGKMLKESLIAKKMKAMSEEKAK